MILTVKVLFLTLKRIDNYIKIMYNMKVKNEQKFREV